MLAAKLTEEYEQLSVVDVEKPSVGRDEVEVEMRAASLCGTDVEYSKGNLLPDDLPVISGHEGAGVVVEVGKDVKDIATGDHVVINYVVSCGNCRPCALGHDTRCRNRRGISTDIQGTFTERMVVPERGVMKIDDGVPFGWASIASCAVATAYHAVKRSGLSDGDTVLVFGVGGVGLHTVMWADFFGATRVIAVDPTANKLSTAEAYGADMTIDPTESDVLKLISGVTDGLGVDVAIECSGAGVAMNQAIEAVSLEAKLAESGTVVAVGRQSTPFEATMEQLMEGEIVVSADHNRHELQEIVSYLGSGRVDLSKSITHQIPFEDINDGLDLIRRAQGGGEDAPNERVGRVVLDMPAT